MSCDGGGVVVVIVCKVGGVGKGQGRRSRWGTTGRGAPPPPRPANCSQLSPFWFIPPTFAGTNMRRSSVSSTALWTSPSCALSPPHPSARRPHHLPSREAAPSAGLACTERWPGLLHTPASSPTILRL